MNDNTMEHDRFSLLENESGQLVSTIALSFDLTAPGLALEVMVKDYPDQENKILAAWSERKPGSDTRIEEFRSLDHLGAQDLQAICAAIARHENLKSVPSPRDLKRNIVSLKQNVRETLQKGSLIVSENMFSVDKVQAWVLVADLRNFSSWLLEATEDDRLTFFQGFADIISYVIQDYHCSYYKLLGDGVLMIWEDGTGPAQETEVAPHRILDVGFRILDLFDNIAMSVSKPIQSFGMAITRGQLIRFVLPSSQSSLCIKDYIGEPINYAARFQALAKAGEILVETKLKDLLEGDGYRFRSRKIRTKLKGVKTQDMVLWNASRPK